MRYYLLLAIWLLALPALSWAGIARPTAVQSNPLSPSKVDVYWSASGPTNGFTIQRLRNGDVNWVFVANVSASTREYVDFNLWAAMGYSYRVRSYKSGGNVSSWTNGPVATTLPLQNPVVLAGAAQLISLPTVILLNGLVTIDGLRPTDIVTYQWTQKSGPAAAVISNSTTLRPTVTFAVPGNYVLTLTAYLQPVAP